MTPILSAIDHCARETLMATLHQLAFYLHVSIGTLALLVFWIPVFTPKGSLDHRRFGRYFAMAMYAVAGSGLLMASMDLLAPFSSHPLQDGMSAAAVSAQAKEVRDAALPCCRWILRAAVAFSCVVMHLEMGANHGTCCSCPG